MVASIRPQWDNQDIASNAAAAVCRLICEMKGIDAGEHEPGLHQVSRDVYEIVLAAMRGRDRMETETAEWN